MFTDRDRQILDFEDTPWSNAAAKENAIRDTFGWTPARYFQALKVAATKPEALEYNPILIHRLVNAETRRAAARAKRDFTER